MRWPRDSRLASEVTARWLLCGGLLLFGSTRALLRPGTGEHVITAARCRTSPHGKGVEWPRLAWDVLEVCPLFLAKGGSGCIYGHRA